MAFIILVSFEFLSFLFHHMITHSLCQPIVLDVADLTLLAGGSTSVEPVHLRASKHHLRPPEPLFRHLGLSTAKVELSLDPVDLLAGLLLALLDLLDLAELLFKLEKESGILRVLGSRGLLQVLHVLGVRLEQGVLAWREVGVVLKHFREVLGGELGQVLVKGLVLQEVLPELRQLLVDGRLTDGARQMVLFSCANVGLGIPGKIINHLELVLSHAFVKERVLIERVNREQEGLIILELALPDGIYTTHERLFTKRKHSPLS